MAPLVSGGVRGRRRGQCGDPERSPPECSGGSGRTADDCRDVLVAGREGSVTGQRRGGGGSPQVSVWSAGRPPVGTSRVDSSHMCFETGDWGGVLEGGWV